MNSFLYPFIITSIAGLSTILGSIIIFLKIKTNFINKFIVLCLSFSISVMIGISITDLIPNSFSILIRTSSIIQILVIIIIAFIASYILINKLENYINKQINNNLYVLGILNMIILMIHNFPEGIATFISSYHDINIGLKISVAIMLHNIPEGISIAVPIYYATSSKLKAIRATFISGLSEPLGAILAYIIFKNMITDKLISIVLIIVGCLMICLSIEQVLPRAKRYKEDKSIVLGIIIGLLFLIINIIIQ